MERVKLLTVTVMGLLLLNLATLGFLYLNDLKGHKQWLEGKPEPKELIQSKLHLDATQLIAYKKLIKWHQNQIRKTDFKIRTIKNKLYMLLNENEIDKKTKAILVDSISFYQKQIELIHFKHFEDIKKLCHKTQKKDFNTLTKELSSIFTQKPPNPRHD